ncbi:MAG: protein kinase [Deltaproteobacteria bacterium]|nr:protein kinase [Deltaproteobacteria bacterium]
MGFLLRPGTIVANRFEIEHLAGKGGMGAVYRARDRKTGMVAAVKVVSDEAPGHHAERLVREAQLLAELQHPSIVRYLALGTTDRGAPYLAMEWLEGEDLALHMRGDGLDARDAVVLATRVAEALGAAHERGIVHRDIKPSNLFLVGGDPARVKVLDFGVARMQLADDGMTRTGSPIGTPRYMAPEQARGSRDVDVRADVFALGCVLFECLAGRPAFSGANQGAVLAKILLEEAPRLGSVRGDLPPALEQLVARMLAKHREDRPRDGRAVAAELAALGDVGTGARRPGRPREAAVSTGEQRLACVVFAEAALEVGPGADRTPSTPSTSAQWPVDEVPPEAQTATMDPRRPIRPTMHVVRRLESIVAEHQGKAEVLKDGSVVVTLFGRSAATDQAASAARCALALRSVLPNAAMALVIGRSSAMDHVPFGELIDRAASVLSRPPPESVREGLFPIYVDDVTAGLLDLRFAIDGDAHGLLLSRQRDVAVATRTLLGKPTSCVGRDRELGMLVATFEECVDEPMAHLVLVTAAAGIGKSRLRYELLQRLAQSGQRFELWLGRGDPMTAGTPFAMLAQALRRLAGVVDDEPAAVSYRKLRARVLRNVAAREIDQVTEFLAELLGVAPPGEGSVQIRAARQDPQLMGDQMLRACQTFLAAECDSTPVVLVLEDLHWSDRATVQFIDSVVRQLAEKPLFVLALARPEVDSVFPRLWADRRVERIQLHELTRRASERLVHETLGDVEPALVARLVERAAGNAFYLEELIRSVVEGRGDRLPETVVAMVQARIGALEVEARHVLRAASIFGQVFWRGGVEALLEGSTTQVEDWIAELVRRELVTVRSESRFTGEAEYTFRHATVREAAYAMVTERDRVIGHRLAGAWLEARVNAGGADVEALALAEHFREGGEPARSAPWYRRAAQQALEGDDLAGAIDCAERAIGCIDASDEHNETRDNEFVGVLRQLQAGAHVWRGEYALAAERGDQALALLSPASVPWLVAAAAVAEACSRRLEHPRVLELCRALAATEVSPPLHHAFAHAVATTMTTLLWHGDPDLIQQLFAQLARIEAAGADPAARAWIYYARAWRALHGGDAAQALLLDQKVEACFTEVGDLRQACRQQASVGYGQLMLGANAAAERSLRDSIAIATRIGLHQVTAQAQHNLGICLARIGRVDEAREVERAALAAFDAQDNRRGCAFARNYLAEIELAAGNADAALTYAREALALDADQPGFHCVYRARIALAHLLAGNAAAALDEATQAMALMDTHGRPEEGEMLVRLAHARALHATGDTTTALAAITDLEQRITAAAARIGDPELSRSFVEDVPEHALARSLARAWRT